MFYIGLAVVIGIMVLTSVLSGKKSGSFSGDRSSGAGLVAGGLIGTLVGGASTVGTAQLAFKCGLSAWWYTLGGGIGLLLLLIFYYPLRKKNTVTIADAVTQAYGTKSGVLLAVLNSIGTFLSFVSQIISGAALIMTVSPAGFSGSVAIVSALIVIYVFFGGAKALGRAGLVKTVLVSLSVAVCGILAVTKVGNLDFVIKSEYFDLFSRGLLVDGGAGMSLLIGVVTTQSYVTAILSARSDKSAIGGTVLSGVLVPLIGTAGIIVGMYMRENFPQIDAKQALPLFITEHMPPIVSGIMIGAILIAVVGTGSGLSFGISTMMYHNLYKPFAKNVKEDKEKTVSRVILLIVVAIGLALCMLNLSDIILDWSFMSMGLRGAASLVPLVLALFCPEAVSKATVFCSMISGAVFTLFGKFILPASIDPMFLGLGVSIAVAIIGALIKKCRARS